MATIILPPRNNIVADTRKRHSYCAILADFARSSTEAEQALKIMDGLLTGENWEGFSQFDGHVGETGCQIRAAMLTEFFMHHKHAAARSKSVSAVPRWLSEAKSELASIRAWSENACFQLSQVGVDPRTLGLGLRQDSAQGILKAVTRNTCPRFSLAHCDKESPTWDLRDGQIMCRFLCYSYILSKYKSFVIKDSVVGCQLHTKLAWEESKALASRFWNLDNRDYRVTKAFSAKAEFQDMQVWISELSCSWIQRRSQSMLPSSPCTRLLEQSVMTSPKGLMATACFPTFLFLRHLWAMSRVRILMVDRYFCKQGFHYHIMRCNLHLMYESWGNEVQPDIRWEVDLVDLEDMKQQDPNSLPCIVVLGNSIAGSRSDYLERIMAPARGHGCSMERLHGSGTCQEDDDHVSELLSTDHDELAKAFFAHHRAYSLPLDGYNSDEQQVREHLCAKIEPPADGEMIRELWEYHSRQINRLRGGPNNMRVFEWQHVFVETEHGLSQLLTKWIQENRCI